MFYSGQIGSLNIIFDCGYEITKYGVPSVENYLKTIKNKTIDLLFLSHFHEDHITGIDVLKQKGIKIKNIVMPYLSVEERLLHAGSSINPAKEYLHFLENPSVFFNTNFEEIENIIYITDNGKQAVNKINFSDTLTDFDKTKGEYQIKFQFDNIDMKDELKINTKVMFFNHHGRVGIFDKMGIRWFFKVFCHKPKITKFVNHLLKASGIITALGRNKFETIINIDYHGNL